MARFEPLPFSILEPMEARSSLTLPAGEGWWFEPKWDGFRCVVFRNGDDVTLQAKSGKSLNRFFPEVVAGIRRLSVNRFIVDGELLVKTDGAFSFEALQMRLHPSETRIRRLANATPAQLELFDMVMSPEGKDLREHSWIDRRRALEAFINGIQTSGEVSLTPGTTDHVAAQGWIDEGALEGVVARRMDTPYLAGERAMVKVKRVRTADCVVGGFRYAAAEPVVGSLLLGLYNDAGLLDHVGFTSAFAGIDKAVLTEKLQVLQGEPGFTGGKPGGPSRWSTDRSSTWTPLKPSMVVEVSFDHVSGGRFRHGTKLLRFRPDKAPSQCTRIQIE